MPFDQLKRREFMTLIGGAAAAWPLSVGAQQAGKVYRTGFLANDPAIPTHPAGQAFLDGLRESGFVEGKNVIIDRRFTEGRLERYDPLVAELAQLRPDVLVTSANEATEAAKRAALAIPIVMMNVSDPVGQGIVASLAHPGSDITGVILDDTAEILAKRMQLLKDAVPHAAKVAVLLNPDVAYDRSEWQQLELAAPSLKVTLRQLVARQPSEIAGAFAAIGNDRPDALLPISALAWAKRGLIIELALKNRLPVMSAFREITEIGGLMSYGSIRVDRFRHAAIYVGKILKGARPADLPVEQPTKYELVINLKTARSLNLEIPRDLLLVADEVIE
jgi:putative tryptophan/tyrosine transport system substrate-binding protein